MTNQESLNFNELLINAGVTPTPVRILVYRFLNQSKSPASLADIESALESVDKSTVSRTLNTFRKHHLVHAF
ncbi:MAG: transcriptional repressor, partial [Muribaculaceae bacterium]|nr:transcriptional repressor [Muribaculaceae bacterium]